MALRQFHSIAHDDDEMYDRAKGMPDGYEPPEFPPGMQFTVAMSDLEKIDATGGDPGDTMHFMAMGTVTSIFRGMEDCRIEVEITQLAGEDGKFADLSNPSPIALCRSVLDKIGLDEDVERGDMLHLIGTVRLEDTMEHEFGHRATLQIVELCEVEDESTEG